jgi:uncharacterized protein (DUF1810 family)
MPQELTGKDKFDLGRFIHAQEESYSDAISELKSGRKRSHWMWFIFPQFKGLGHSSTSIRYSIKSIDEARAYLQHPVLGPKLNQCAEAVLALDGKTASEIFGYPDDLKLKSSMTLFEQVAGHGSLFSQILDKYFDGERDVFTLDLLNE